MTRRALAFLTAVVVGLLALATPARAGNGTWSSTACYGEAPYNAAWLGTPGLGANYSSQFAAYDEPLQFITWHGLGQSYVQLLGDTHAYYAAAGYECGRFGLPYEQGVYASPVVTYQWTYFVKPGSCDMRFIIEVLNGGPTFEGVAADYFCQ